MKVTKCLIAAAALIVIIATPVLSGLVLGQEERGEDTPLLFGAPVFERHHVCHIDVKPPTLAIPQRFDFFGPDSQPIVLVTEERIIPYTIFCDGFPLTSAPSVMSINNCHVVSPNAVEGFAEKGIVNFCFAR